MYKATIRGYNFIDTVTSRRPPSLEKMSFQKKVMDCMNALGQKACLDL